MYGDSKNAFLHSGDGWHQSLYCHDDENARDDALLIEGQVAGQMQGRISTAGGCGQIAERQSV